MENIYKSTEERLKGDPYIGVCIQALETLECLLRSRLLYRLGIDRDQCLYHSSKVKARGVNRDKKKWVQTVDPCNNQANQVRTADPCTRRGF